MGTQEPRIFTPRPKWADMQELSRSIDGVWFASKYGRMMVPLKYVEDWEKRSK